MATLSRVTGVAFALGFGSVIAGAGAGWSLVTFTAAVILMCGYLTVVATVRYKAS